MRIWCLVSNAEDQMKEAQKNATRIVGEGNELVFVDHASIQIGSGDMLRVFYLGEELELPDAFWMWTTNTDARMVEHMLIANGVLSIVDIAEQSVARSKVLSYDRMARAGLPIPRTLVFFHQADRERIKQQFDYPFVIKPDNGFGGMGVALIHDDEELDAYLATLEFGVAYMAQEYISTSKGRDIRVVTLNGEPLYSVKRQNHNSDEFRSNVHLGGEASWYEIDEPTKELCRKAASLFGLKILGLDLLFGEDGFVFTEVNSFPGFDQERSSAGIHAIQTVIAEFCAEH